VLAVVPVLAPCNLAKSCHGSSKACYGSPRSNSM
jgi:hypothetical protein